MFTMYVQIISLEKVDYNVLFPAPSLQDYESMENMPSSNRGLDDQPYRVIMNYRGGLLILENGAQVYRSNPLSFGGNGYSGHPTSDEDVYIDYDSVIYKAKLRFNV